MLRDKHIPLRLDPPFPQVVVADISGGTAHLEAIQGDVPNFNFLKPRKGE